jgi:uncharacterized membrane-anchored protein
MQALRELLTTDIGLLSLLVLVVVMGIGVYLYRWFQARIREEAGAAQSPRRMPDGR